MKIFSSKFQYLTISIISIITGYLFGLSSIDYFIYLYFSFFIFSIIRFFAFFALENHKKKFYILLKRIYLTISLTLFIHLIVFNIKNIINQKKGDEIVRIIEKYKMDNNRYPENLDVLIPIYIDKNPEYFYNHKKSKMFYNKSKNGYILEYFIDGDRMNSYRSEYKKWTVTD